MVIKIPSKHIYNDKSFDPVVDNNIEKIEIEEKTPQINNDTISILNTSKTPENIGNWAEIEAQKKSSYSQVSVSSGLFNTYTAYAYVEEYPQYTEDIKFTIPKSTDNYRVIRMLTGEDKNGQPNIKYSLRGNIVKWDLIGTVDWEYNAFSEITFGEIDYNYVSDTKDEQLSTEFTIEPDISYTYNYYASSTGNFITSATVDFELDNKSNILTATATDNGNNEYEIDLKILRALRIYKLGGGSGTNQGTSGTMDLSGKFEQYVATQIDISFYGDVIKLDLQNKTLTVGSGDKVFSLSGNELIQSTNTPTIESKCQSVIDKWKNGKQTATISCPITDYYDTDGNKVIDVSISGKMLFDEGDIVIPYTYTINGDKPMSYNNDLSPKQFRIVGVGLSKEQGGTQELTLQEI